MKKLLLALVFAGTAAPAETIRVGFLPNVTQAPVLVGLARQEFQKELGDKIDIKPLVFNAGPSAVEALFAKEVDLIYVGPNGAINAFLKSKGQAAKVLAGAASGGARLIVRPGLKIANAADFSGKKIATPQLGNTQDVAARAWLSAHDLKSGDQGGTVQIINVKNPDQLSLFARQQIDAVWAVEPWATRLVQEAHGTEFLDERTLWPQGKFSTALLVVNPQFADAHPDWIAKWLRAQVRVTRWIQKNPTEATTVLSAEIQHWTGKALPVALVTEANRHLDVTYDPIAASLQQAADQAYQQGFLGHSKPDLQGMVDLRALNQILKEEKLKQIN